MRWQTKAISLREESIMLTRRSVTALLAGVAAAPVDAWGANAKPDAAFYNAVGPTLTCWHVDVDKAELTRQGSITAPALVQYAWRHPTKPLLYLASSNFVSIGKPDGKHHLTAFRIDPDTGALSAFGAPVAIRARPINITVDVDGKWLLTAYNVPSTMSVHPLGPDGAIGVEIVQQGPIDGGIYAHQVRMLPSDKSVVLVTRGNNATAEKPEDPGALKIKGLRDGQLTDIASIAPGSGYGFGPRHVDFHPSKPWMFVSVERQNQLHMYRAHGDDLEPAPAFVLTTLSEPGHLRPEQMVGPIHMHPSGRHVYVGNRASGVIEAQGRKFAAGGENTIAMFAIDQETGEPRLTQAIDTHGFHPRTFPIDPSGRMLVAANLIELPVRDGDQVRTQPATLSTYQIGSDGRLTFVKSYDIETNGLLQFWSGFVRL
jgi:6-phosphogluconolactonase (cycloisomerase 2 family)